MNPLAFEDPTSEFRTIMLFIDSNGDRVNSLSVNFTHSLEDQSVKILRVKASISAYFILEADNGNYYGARATDPYSRRISSGFGITACPEEPERQISPHVFSTICVTCHNRTKVFNDMVTAAIPQSFCT